MKLRLATIFLVFLSASAVCAQTKKEKIIELLSYKLNEKTIAAINKGMDKVVARLPLMKQESDEGNDSIRQIKIAKIKVLIKDFGLDALNKMKETAPHLYDSAFTELQIDEQLAFLRSDIGKKVQSQGSESISSAEVMKIVEEETSGVEHKFEYGKKEKIDSFINLTTPKTSSISYSGYAPYMRDGLQKMFKDMINAEKDVSKKKEMQERADSFTNARLSDSALAAYMDKYKLKIDNLKKSERAASIDKLEVYLDVKYSAKELDELIAHYSSPNTASMKETERRLYQMVTEQTMKEEMAKYMGKMVEILKGTD